MKTVVFGDIHGSHLWKTIMDKEHPDKVIFLGDFFDPYNRELVPDMYSNFRNILKLKEEMGDDCIILIGNHDYHYMGFNGDYSSRYSMTTYDNMHKTLHDCYADGRMKFAYEEDGILFTHAGVSKYWLENVAYIKESDLSAEELNVVDPNLYTFNNLLDRFDMYGDSKSQSPIWIRPEALLKNAVEPWTQIVGHTRFKKSIWSKDNAIKNDFNFNLPNIYFNDSLEFGGYIVIEDKNIECRNV